MACFFIQQGDNDGTEFVFTIMRIGNGVAVFTVYSIYY